MIYAKKGEIICGFPSGNIPTDWIICEEPVISDEPVDTTAFDQACEAFKMVCREIKEKANLSVFYGGFDEMAEYQNSEFAGTLEGLKLAILWSSANELCKYEGAKIGLNQPQWWYKCWNITKKD